MRIQDSDAFVPARGLDGGHRMTLYTWARPRRFPQLPPPEPRYFDVAPDARVLAHCHWRSPPATRPALLALHGLEGSSAAHYMRGLADKALAAGFNVVLLNQRNCGGTEHLSRGLYHSGLSADPAAVIRELAAVDGVPEVAVVGYSLGGNVGLRLAGATPPDVLRAVCAVSPTMDLAGCVDALERPQNAAYQWNFVRNLKRRMRRKARVLPGLFDIADLHRIRTVRAFDDAFTAPHHGFRNAADYYHRASSLQVVDRIAVPALIVSAEDDPFVPPEQFRHAAIASNPNVTTAITRYGGHCGFYAEPAAGFDGYWAERTAVDFLRRHVAAARRPEVNPGPDDPAGGRRTPDPRPDPRA